MGGDTPPSPEEGWREAPGWCDDRSLENHPVGLRAIPLPEKEGFPYSFFASSIFAIRASSRWMRATRSTSPFAGKRS
jgi:hypothetical protein